MKINPLSTLTAMALFGYVGTHVPLWPEAVVILTLSTIWTLLWVRQ